MTLSSRVDRKERPLFGRRGEVDAIAGRFQEGQRLVTLLSIGGMGKSRVASALARETHSAVLVDLASVCTRATLVSALSRALEVPTPPTAKPARSPDALAKVTSTQLARLASRLEERGRVLIVLDNFEKLVDEATLLGELLDAAPGVCFLVTTRESLGLSYESIFELGPLEINPFGVDLFLDVMQRRPEGSLPTCDRDVVAEIVRGLGGIPLAIERAAERASLLGLEAVVSSVERRVYLSAAGSRDADERHRTLLYAFKGSWDALRMVERETLCIASVFHGGFTSRDLAALAPPGLDVLGALERLRALALVQCAPPSMRLGARAVVRDCVHAVAPIADVAALRQRHADYFAAELARKLTSKTDGASGFVADEWDNLVAAAQHHAATSATNAAAAEKAARVLLGIGESALRKGHLHLLREHVESLAHANDPRTGAELWMLRARAERKVGNVSESLTSFRHAKTLAEESGDAALMARALRLESLWLARVGQLDEARAAFEQASHLHDPADDDRSDVHDVLGLASALRQAGDVARAKVVVENYLRAATDDAARTPALLELAGAYLQSHAHQAAITAASEALTTARRRGWRAESARALLFIALAHLLSGDLIAAEPGLHESIECGEDGVFAAAYAKGYLGILYFETGRNAEADASLRDALPPDGGHAALFASFRASVFAQRDDLAGARAVALDAARADVPPYLRAAIALHRVHIELAEAREAAKAGDLAHAAVAYAHATAAVDGADATDSDTALALRIARRALADQCPPFASMSFQSLTVHESGWPLIASHASSGISVGRPSSCGNATRRRTGDTRVGI